MNATAATTTWAIDNMHSEVHFKIKHLVISTVTGSFKTFNGTASINGDDVESASIEFTLDVNSVDTNQAQRDGHLKSADFFAAAAFPEIKFVSSSLKKVKGDLYRLSGELTMKGITKTVEVDAEYGGTAKDGYGNTKMGFEVSGNIHRKDFGLNWNAALEAGGLTLGEDVKLIANIQLLKQA